MRTRFTTPAGLVLAIGVAGPLFAATEIGPPRAGPSPSKHDAQQENVHCMGNCRPPRSNNGDYDGYKDPEEYCAHNLSTNESYL